MNNDDADEPDELDDDEEFDEYDDEDGEEDGSQFPCPHCNDTGSCRHMVLFWSVGNGDWVGSLPDAAAAAWSRLESSLWSIAQAKRAEFAAQKWPMPLASLVEIVTQEDFHDERARPEGWERVSKNYYETPWLYEAGPAMKSYLRDLLVEACEALGDEPFEHEWGSEGGGPGLSDNYGVIYVKHPDETLAAVKRLVESDLEAITTWANLNGKPAG